MNMQMTSYYKCLNISYIFYISLNTIQVSIVQIFSSIEGIEATSRPQFYTSESHDSCTNSPNLRSPSTPVPIAVGNQGGHESAFHAETPCLNVTAHPPTPDIRAATIPADEDAGQPKPPVPAMKRPSHPPRLGTWPLCSAPRPLLCIRCLLAASAASLSARLAFLAAVRAAFSAFSTSLFISASMASAVRRPSAVTPYEPCRGVGSTVLSSR